MPPTPGVSVGCWGLSSEGSESFSSFTPTPSLLPPWPLMNAADPVHPHSSHVGQTDVCTIQSEERSRWEITVMKARGHQRSTRLEWHNPPLLFPNIGIWSDVISDVRYVISAAYQRCKSVIWGQKPWGTSEDGPSVPSTDTDELGPTSSEQGGCVPQPPNLTSPHCVERPTQGDRDAEI